MTLTTVSTTVLYCDNVALKCCRNLDTLLVDPSDQLQCRGKIPSVFTIVCCVYIRIYSMSVDNDCYFC